MTFIQGNCLSPHFSEHNPVIKQRMPAYKYKHICIHGLCINTHAHIYIWSVKGQEYSRKALGIGNPETEKKRGVLDTEGLLADTEWDLQELMEVTIMTR